MDTGFNHGKQKFNMIKEMKYVTLKPGKMFLLILSYFITTFQVLNKFIKLSI